MPLFLLQTIMILQQMVDCARVDHVSLILLTIVMTYPETAVGNLKFIGRFVHGRLTCVFLRLAWRYSAGACA